MEGAVITKYISILISCIRKMKLKVIRETK